MEFIKQLIYYDYIDKNIEHKIKEYKYIGGDDSWIYQNVTKKIALFCINNFVPEWIAPNVITFFGLSCILIPHLILTYYYSKVIDGEVSQWFSLLIGILHLIYMNADNMDGIQARKTGNASPLGLLVDHGCDANVVYIQGLVVLNLMGYGQGMPALISYFLPSAIFYISTLEQYLIEEMIVPPIDFWGQISIVCLFLISSILGQQFWFQDFYGFKINQIVMWIYILFFAQFFIVFLVNIKTRMQNYNRRHNANLQVMDVFYYSACFILMFVVNVYLLYFSNSQIYQRKIRLLMYIYGMNVSQLVSRMHISHIVSCEFRQWRPIIVIIYATLFLNCHFYIFDEDNLVNFFLFATVVSHGHMWLNIFRQFTTVLGIKLLKVKDKVQTSPQQQKIQQQESNGTSKKQQ